MRFDRDFYRPSATETRNAVIKHTVSADPVAEYYTWGENGIPYVKAFGGKRSKPDFYVRFRTETRRAEKIQEWLTDMTAYAANRATARAERNKPHTLKVGSILSASWGYDQTNVDFYEVIETKGRSTVIVRQIGSTMVECNGPSTHVTANPGSFIGEPMTKRARANNSIRIASYSCAYEWDGKPKYETGWGYGH